MGDTLQVITGLAVGIAFVVAFASLFNYTPSAQSLQYHASQSEYRSAPMLINGCDPPPTAKGNQPIATKERTWISVSRFAGMPQTIHDKRCTIVTSDLLSEIPKLEAALKGADGCVEGTEVCQVSYGMSMSTLYDIAAVDDSQDYELSLSKEEAEKITSEIGIVGNLAVLAYKDNFYLLALNAADSDEVGIQMATEFVEPVTWHPVPLEQGQSLEYTILIKTWATYGEPAEFVLKAGTLAKDSGLDIQLEPDHLVIQERSEARVKVTITAGNDAKDGIYDMYVTGRINDSIPLQSSPCGLGGQCPVIQIGDSNWEIRTYGSSTGFGMYSNNEPPVGLWLEVRTDKQAYAEGESVQIEAYFVNDGREKVVLEGARLIMQVADLNIQDSINYAFSIDSIYSSSVNETIAVEPKSEVLLARAFQWDQKTFESFDFNSSSYPVASGTYAVSASFSGYQGYVFHDRKRVQIGAGDATDDSENEFNGITIIIPQGASETGYGGRYFIPDVQSVSAGAQFRWENDDIVPHTATSGSPGSGSDTLFDTSIIRPEEFSQSFSIDTPGQYQYYCFLHPWMTGTIKVE
jgi:plastocyanin